MDASSIASTDSPDPDLNATVCLLCRQRKTKCDRKLPKCSNCMKGKLDCFYVTVQRKPGLRAGYVSELENRISILEKDVLDLKSKEILDPSAEDRSRFLTADLESRSVLPTTHLQSHQAMAPCNSLIATSGIPDDLLSPAVFPQLLDYYFTFYQPWFPILHRPSILSAYRSSGGTPAKYLPILKAIVAVTSPRYRNQYWGENKETEYNSREPFHRLQHEVIIHAMEHLSLISLQALLIVSIADLSYGRMSNFWKTVSLCRNMGTQLGLRDLVVYYGQNYNQLSIVAPRMLPLPDNIIDREERIRAYWMIECLDASSTLGAAWNIGLFPSFPSEILPCADKAWENMKPSTQCFDQSSNSESFSFAVYTSLVTKELNRVHNVMQEPYDLSLPPEQIRWLTNCNEVYEELCAWRSSTLETPFQASGFDVEGNSRFDVNIISANIALDSAIIAMYQKQALENQSSGIPLERCINASNNIAAISGIISNKFQYLGPRVVLPIFVAGRFLMVLSKSLQKPMQPNMQAVLDMLREAKTYWHIGTILEKVLATAELEHVNSSPGTSLPPQFFDLKYSSLDIYEALRVWCDGSENLTTDASGDVNFDTISENIAGRKKE